MTPFIWFLSLLSININTADFIISDVCYKNTTLNSTACCISLRNQCEFGSETQFNCTIMQTNLMELTMSKCELSGTLPSEITQLEFLTHFDLSDNYFEGNIPEQIGDMGYNGYGLKYIDLSTNQLDGTIPKSIGDERLAGELQHLDLSHNQLTRANMPSITQLSLLEYLDLSDNNIAENFHESFGDFKALRVLNLGTNRFSGAIPYTMGELTELRILNIERNSMSGTLPKELSQIHDLQILNISQNKFTGEIPAEWGTDWGVEKLEFLNLGYNDFDCPVREYTQWATHTDFVESYGENGETNCVSEKNSSASEGLSGVEVAIIVIAVIVLLSIVAYCWHAKRQSAVREQVSMLHDKDVFDS